MLVGGCGGESAVPEPSGPVDISMDDAVVSTADGAVRGVVNPDHRVFQGIPYADPPVGPLRWQPPQPSAPWPGVRDADKPGPWCIQPDSDGLASEDCLTLNVWTPTGTAPEGLPVMVWIHGGSFVKGSGDIYHARRLTVDGHIVVVTINYRLGALGFLADPALGEPGNYGLADQQAALRWVRDNIAKFGGDPAKVTIAGESAGAMSVCDHLAAPDSAGLFRAAIIQSGPCQAQVGVAEAQRISRDYAATVGCAVQAAAPTLPGPAPQAGQPAQAAQAGRVAQSGQAACLRAVPAGRLTAPLWYARFGTDQLSGPVTGTRTLPEDPVTVFADGGAARVPVLIGTNRDEFTMFVALRYLRTGHEISVGEYPAAVSDTFGDQHTSAVLEHYPPALYGDSVSLAFSAAATDDVFACLADRMAGGLVHSSPAVYAYEFDDPRAPAPPMYQQAPFSIGASHSLEMHYLFDVGDLPPMDPAQHRLAGQMVDYWSAFVSTGAPQASDQPDWPAVGADADAEPWMSLRPDGSRVVTDFAGRHQCPFWADVRR
ncbi:MAG TPA: carboxylesterase family protein [Mycobacterium sp.]|nr:carboxylesterase family protein [Mycobacterium sp.]